MGAQDVRAVCGVTQPDFTKGDTALSPTSCCGLVPQFCGVAPSVCGVGPTTIGRLREGDYGSWRELMDTEDIVC